MNNTFDFSYFVPTPDTTANCALSRWNDGLMGLSDFLKSYMSSRQSLEFGFSRNLNIKELLNLAKSTVYDDNHKFDYVINYRKFGDIKANVCGFDIPIVDFNHPFLVQEVLRNATTNEIIDFLSPYKVGISHVYNCNSTLSESERVEATKDALDRFKTAIQDQTLISDDQLHIIFKKNNGNYRTRQQIINELDTAISVIDNLSSGIVDFIFGFESREKLESISGNYPIPGTNSYNTSSHDFYRDFCCNTYCCTSTGSVATFILNISDCYKQEFQDRYLTPFGIEFSYVEPLHYRRNANEKSHLLLFFKFDITEKPTIAPFVSHDGTLIPTTEQRFNIQYSLQYSKNRGTYILYKSYWDNSEECPVYFDAENVAHPMTLESNINGMGGRDYTFWSSPVQKTESGYQFECCMPLAFYNAESDSYSNEYYATKAHEGIEIGEVMYRVPVVKRMRQNIEEAIVNTHLTKCLSNLVPATNENAEDDDTVVLGGVVVDDFTEGLYPVAETQKIATETEYGEVKIVKVKDSDGDDNGVLDLMYHYSETGDLSYDGMTMPETGRAVDMITLFDTLKAIGGDNNITDHTFVVNGVNKNINVQTTGDSSSSFSMNEFNIILKNTYSDSNTNKTCEESITFMGDGQIYINSSNKTDKYKTELHTEPKIVSFKASNENNTDYMTESLNVNSMFWNVSGNSENELGGIGFGRYSPASNRTELRHWSFSGKDMDIGSRLNAWRDVFCDTIMCNTPCVKLFFLTAKYANVEIPTGSSFYFSNYDGSVVSDTIGSAQIPLITLQDGTINAISAGIGNIDDYKNTKWILSCGMGRPSDTTKSYLILCVRTIY